MRFCLHLVNLTLQPCNESWSITNAAACVFFTRDSSVNWASPKVLYISAAKRGSSYTHSFYFPPS